MSWKPRPLTESDGEELKAAGSAWILQNNEYESTGEGSSAFSGAFLKSPLWNQGKYTAQQGQKGKNTLQLKGFFSIIK